ncbi:MAG: hypothetical protein SWO11_22690 [Thermodesulfobacteriota bacterium]|nr:hypothetical protein [Thermodesulfobacteriota bacterium]
MSKKRKKYDSTFKSKDEEIHRLKQELKKVQEERDIIKKALVYFAEDRK